MEMSIFLSSLLIINLLLEIDIACSQENSHDSNKYIDPNRETYKSAETGYFTVELHNVTTEDGYELTIWRMPGSPDSLPVYLHHGLLESSAFYLIAGEKSLGYYLHQRGYDVWFGNTRGNTYSKKHKTLSTEDPAYWNYTWFEVGKYDIPAAIDYVTNLRNKNVHYVGHSMGATFFAVASIERPDIGEKIKSFVGLAPAVYCYHTRSIPVQIINHLQIPLRIVLERLGINEILPRSPVLDFLANDICTNPLLKYSVCANFLFSGVGWDFPQLNSTLVPEIFRILPAGTSRLLVLNWLQQIKVNAFKRYDYGSKVNTQMYGTKEPPYIDLTKVSPPVAVLFGENDLLVGPQDAMKFYEQVPNKLGIFRIDDDKFNHMDFLWAINAPEKVYPKVLDVLIKVDNN